MGLSRMKVSRAKMIEAITIMHKSNITMAEVIFKAVATKGFAHMSDEEIEKLYLYCMSSRVH
ncbi:hypothetical protein FHS18_003714 [Paenibacillus phyllosphaerae]|uniref:Uncharacterized protein n=1 Tax=Paenibacillus phyllosphaerae TaxID=274593 RepID=A0A7W5B0H0_9BACL|nr:hypothetical protein [Paenibacillus phyllosphaerae]MBB3111646.1 hypothetical protein [Paenibacillus phyllosphaerae]